MSPFQNCMRMINDSLRQGIPSDVHNTDEYRNLGDSEKSLIDLLWRNACATISKK